MSNWFEPTAEQLAAWEKWVAERPDEVRAVAEKLKPWKLYRLHDDKGEPTAQRVTVRSIQEADPPKYPKPTVTVNISAQFNLVAFERGVFGIDPDRLVECDLPEPIEEVGSAGLTPEEALAALPKKARAKILARRKKNLGD